MKVVVYFLYPDIKTHLTKYKKQVLFFARNFLPKNCSFFGGWVIVAAFYNFLTLLDLVLDDIGCVSVVSLSDVGAVEVGGAGEQMEEGGVENSTKGIWLVFAGGSGGLVFWVPCVHFFSRFLMIIITIARVMTSAQTKNHI